MNQEKGKCRFCRKIIDQANIRCDKCDLVWQDGLELGKQEIKREVSEKIKSLLIYEPRK